MAVVSNKNGRGGGGKLEGGMPDVEAKLLVLEKSSSRSVITELLLLHLFDECFFVILLKTLRRDAGPPE